MSVITVHDKPSSSRDGIEKISEFEYIVRTTQPPVQGRANRAIIQLLAEYFDIPVSGIHIVSGHTSRIKRISLP